MGQQQSTTNSQSEKSSGSVGSGVMHSGDSIASNTPIDSNSLSRLSPSGDAPPTSIDPSNPNLSQGSPPTGSNFLTGDEPPAFPGTFQDLHKVKEVFPTPADGVTVTFNKGLNQNFQAGHKLNFATMQPSSYKYMATYIGSKSYSPTEAFPVCLGEVDFSGNLSAQIIHAFNRRNRTKLAAQVQAGKWQALEIGTDYRFNSMTAALTVVNPDILAGHGIMVGQFLGAPFSVPMALGYECVFRRLIPPFGSQLFTGMSHTLVTKYRSDNVHVGAQLSLDGDLQASYYRKVGEHKQFGVELEGKGLLGGPKECLATAGFTFEVPNTSTVCKAAIDTKGTIVSSVESQLTPLPANIGFTVHGNLLKNQYICGLNCTFGL